MEEEEEREKERESTLRVETQTAISLYFIIVSPKKKIKVVTFYLHQFCCSSQQSFHVLIILILLTLHLIPLAKTYHALHKLLHEQLRQLLTNACITNRCLQKI